MSEIVDIKVNNVSHDIVDAKARERIGELDKLNTTNKNSLVDAINEAMNNGGGASTTPPVTSYNKLLDKPMINNKTLQGQMTAEELGLQSTLLPGANIKIVNNTISAIGGVGGSADTSNLILPHINENLINENELIGGTIAANGDFTESTTAYVTDFIELKPNTYYQVYSSSYFVLYPEDKTYVNTNYYDIKKHHSRPYTFNTGNTIKYIRISVKKSREWSHKYFLIEKEQYSDVNDLKPYGRYFVRDNIEKYNFYKPVVYKTRDLYNIFKPTAICMEGDSITDGVKTAHSYANQFIEYVLDNFNDKKFQVPIFDEHVVNCVESYYPGHTGGATLTKARAKTGEITTHDYLELSFYGSYFGVNTYANFAADVPIDVIIDDELYAVINFSQYANWNTEELSMDYHTARIQISDSYEIPSDKTGVTSTVGSFEVKKYVTAENIGVWGSGSQSKLVRYKNGEYDKYDIIFCMIGTNDRTTEGYPGIWDYNIRQTFKHGLEAMGKEVVIMSATPSSREWIDNDKKHTGFYQMKDVVNWTNSIGAKDNEEIISFYHFFMNWADLTGQDVETLLGDGLHPNLKGHTLMCEYLIERCGWGKPNRKSFPVTTE